jgi:hypothetical protein
MEVQSRWLRVTTVLLKTSFILVASLVLVIVWGLARGFDAQKIWIPRVAFCLGTVWTLGLAWLSLRSFGVGLAGSVFVLGAVIAGQSAVIALLAFSSWWRVLAILPIIMALRVVLSAIDYISTPSGPTGGSVTYQSKLFHPA